ncbi:hypothetical protein DFH28DRAFT_926626 [Melampsora americana]|nr:hypothetical protein DFH28DRAFT_926626 [Melampsora americana]
MGCTSQAFKLDGVLYCGVDQSKGNASAHASKLEAIWKETQDTVNGLPLQVQNNQARDQSTGTVPTVVHNVHYDEIPDEGSPIIPNQTSPSSQWVDTSAYCIREVYLCHPLGLIPMLMAAHSNITSKTSQQQCRRMLHLAKFQIQQALVKTKYIGAPLWDEIPTALATVFDRLKLDIKINSELCCPSCFALNGTPFPKNKADYKLNCDHM